MELINVNDFCFLFLAFFRLGYVVLLLFFRLNPIAYVPLKKILLEKYSKFFFAKLKRKKTFQKKDSVFMVLSVIYAYIWKLSKKYKHTYVISENLSSIPRLPRIFFCNLALPVRSQPRFNIHTSHHLSPFQTSKFSFVLWSLNLFLIPFCSALYSSIWFTHPSLSTLALLSPIPFPLQHHPWNLFACHQPERRWKSILLPATASPWLKGEGRQLAGL